MQAINHGWFYTTGPQRNDALLPTAAINRTACRR